MTKTYKFRIEEYDNNFYPQVEIKTILGVRWKYIDMMAPNEYRLLLERPVPKEWSHKIEEANALITNYINYFKPKEVKYHNEREETIG